jgi:hypothetical protein
VTLVVLRFIYTASVLLSLLPLILITGVWDLHFLPWQPPLIRRIPSGTDKSVDSAFDAHVKSAFPIGLSEAELLRELEEQGFDVDDEVKIAHYRTSAGGPCSAAWVVSWRADEAGAVAKISGRMLVKCL